MACLILGTTSNAHKPILSLRCSDRGTSTTSTTLSHSSSSSPPPYPSSHPSQSHELDLGEPSLFAPHLLLVLLQNTVNVLDAVGVSGDYLSQTADGLLSSLLSRRGRGGGLGGLMEMLERVLGGWW